MVTTLIFLRNKWKLLFWSVPLIDKRGLCAFARAVIVVDVVSTCCRAWALQFCLATRGWTPVPHPVHFMRGRTRINGKCRFGPVKSTATVDNSTTLSRSFTMAMQHVLSSISPARDRRRYRSSSSTCTSNCIHALRKNNNIVTMPTRDVLLCRFCKCR